MFNNSITKFDKSINSKDWLDEDKILAYTTKHNTDPNQITINNIRNFTYYKDGTHKSNYYNKNYDISKLKKIYYAVQPFAFFNLVAHTFVSFEFENDTFLSISVEIRKKKSDKKTPFSKLYLKSLFNSYELIYVVGDEKDLIKYRTNYLKESIHLYPFELTSDINQDFFKDMINRVDKLKKQPEYYHPWFNNCTTNLVKHVNKIRIDKIKLFNLAILFPGLSDKLAHKLKLIQIPKHLKSAKFKQIQNYYKINKNAQKYGNYEDFSTKIRQYSK